NATAAQGIAVDDKHVYWTGYLTATVFRVGLGGGAVEPFAQTAPGTGHNANGIVIDDGAVHWPEQPPDGIRGCSKAKSPCPDGGTLVASSPEGFTHGLATNDTDVFWMTGDKSDDGGSVYRVNKSGGLAAPISYELLGPRSIAVQKNAAFVTGWL